MFSLSIRDVRVGDEEDMKATEDKPPAIHNIMI